MPLISSRLPATWQELEASVAAILSECGMAVDPGALVRLPRGDEVKVDVLADETLQGITQRIICECKYWDTNVTQEKVHAFRTVMQESGANRGYIVAKTGFQPGAISAAQSTNIELVTWEEFQERYFAKWFNSRLWAIENAIDGFHSYYEPLGRPGYDLLTTDAERAAYDAVWDKYFFAGAMLVPFSPYLNMVGNPQPPPLPMDVSLIEERGFVVPDEVKHQSGYRELLALLEAYGRVGLEELRVHNPRHKTSAEQSSG